MIGILIRARLHRFLLVSDVEKAFNQIMLHEPDRDYCRFLWLKDPADANSVLIAYRFLVLIFGATCSPFCLAIVIKKHLAEYPGRICPFIENEVLFEYIKQVITDIDNNLYVDM